MSEQTIADLAPDPTAPAPHRAHAQLTGGWAVALIAGLGVFVVALRVVHPERLAWLRAAIIVFGGLVIDAGPFVLLGALVSALIEVFVPPSMVERLAELPRPLQLPAAGLAGMAFPICECGSVPVARRLMSKGLMPGAAITFMLASPALNPVVLAATFVAYRGRTALWTMVLGRFGLALLVAMAAGWVLGTSSKDELLRSVRTAQEPDHVELGHPEPRWRTFFVHLGSDFLFMAKFVLLGATIAAVVQTFVPQPVLASLARVPVLDAVVMIGLAFVLSLCSTFDAFIAASFVQFGSAAQLAFLVFGPMVDFKLSALYAGTFSRGVLRTIVITVAVTTLVGAMWIKVFAG
jgi:uncharacterized protein